MKFVGKKTDVLQLPAQLRSDPELGAAVRFLASVNSRTIQLQILFWIVEGVEKEQARLRQAPSADVIQPAEPKSVKVRSRQEKLA
jgi:hypothetical protein